MKLLPIIFVDDNTDLANALELSLREEGFQVLTAASGDKAIDFCREGVVADIAVVDLKVPGMDGPTTIAAMRAQRPELKVIAVSGKELSPYLARLADLGVRYSVPNPFPLAALAIHEAAALRKAA